MWDVKISVSFQLRSSSLALMTHLTAWRRLVKVDKIQGYGLSIEYFGVIWLGKKNSFPSGKAVRKSACNAGDTRDWGSILGSRRSPREGNGYPLQYSFLENSMDRGA